MKERRPEVSICIPTYNGAKYIGETIASTLKQRFTDFELIVVDDCSADKTEAIVNSFSDSRLKFLKNHTRFGLVGNFNRCLELATSEFICIFHQDDVMLPDNIEKKLRILKENSSVGLVHSNCYRIDANGHTTGAYWPNEIETGIENGSSYFQKMIMGNNPICCPSVLVRKRCYESLGAFDERLRLTCDWEMWMRIALFHDISYLAEPLIMYREHESNESHKYKGNIRGLREAYLAKKIVLERFADRIPNAKSLKTATSSIYAEMARDSAYGCYYRKRYSEAKDYMAFALKLHPALMKDGRAIRLIAKLLLGERGTELVKKAKSILGL